MMKQPALVIPEVESHQTPIAAGRTRTYELPAGVRLHGASEQVGLWDVTGSVESRSPTEPLFEIAGNSTRQRIEVVFDVFERLRLKNKVNSAIAAPRLADAFYWFVDQFTTLQIPRETVIDELPKVPRGKNRDVTNYYKNYAFRDPKYIVFFGLIGGDHR